ncbi:MAG TPA: MarR family transcriptional regulator [Chloroflexota bacterium]
MRLTWQWVREQIFLGVVAAGYDDVNRAHVGLFRYPTLDRLHPSELADQLQITKQSINDLLGHLEQHGYLVREPELSDRRARIVRLTTKGRRLDKTVNRQARATEQRIAEMLGQRSFAQLHQSLEELAERITRNPSPATGRRRNDQAPLKAKGR